MKTHFKIIIIISIALYTAAGCKDERYWLLWLLPVTYVCILVLINFAAGEKSKEIGYRVIKIVMFFRYVVTPFTVISSQYYSGYGPEPQSDTLTKAIILMAYELVIVGISIAIYSRKRRSNSVEFLNTSKITRENTVLSWLFILIVFVLLSIIDINFIIPKNVLTMSNVLQASSLGVDGGTGLYYILRNIFRIIIGATLLNLIYGMKINERLKIVLSLLSLIFVISLYTSAARWDTLTVSIVGILILRQLYPRYSKVISVTLSLVMIVALTSITMYKFLGYDTASKPSIYNALTQLLNVISKQFQMYFSGPRNVAQAMDMGRHLNVSLDWIFNDIFGSIPGLSRFFNQEIRFNLLFNRYVYYSSDNISQIIPLLGIGYISFGALFSPLLMTGFVILILKLNNIYIRKVLIYDKYILLYMIIFTSFCMGMNLQILSNKYFAVFIPSVLLIFLNRWFHRLFSKKKA